MFSGKLFHVWTILIIKEFFLVLELHLYTRLSENDPSLSESLVKRHLSTQKETETGLFRVVSYNILADYYINKNDCHVDLGCEPQTLYPYCDPLVFVDGRRQSVLLHELKGYHGDIVCLQEVDTDVYDNLLSSSMTSMGYGGSFKQKVDRPEGPAIFYRTSKFRLIKEYGESLSDILEARRFCKVVRDKVYLSPGLKKAVLDKGHVIQVHVYEHLDIPGRFIVVANIHLFSHELGEAVRLVQTIVALKYIQSILDIHSEKAPCLVLCGDFNSRPYLGVYMYITSQTITGDSKHWKDGGDELLAHDMTFSHDLNLASACGILPYTYYTPDYVGHLDYIYYDTDKVTVAMVTPPPDHQDMVKHKGLPSVMFPSDHIAQICDLKWIK